MMVIQKEIYQNLATTILPYGNGQTGLWGIMMPNVLYVQCFNKLFGQSTDPGKHPDNIPTNASAQQWSEILIHHKAAKQVYDTYKTMIQCNHNQFQKAIDEDNLAELDNPDVGLTNIHPSIIYQHIMNWNAKIDLKMAEQNQKMFNEFMDPTKPLMVHTKKQERCQAFVADAGNPIIMQTWYKWG